jgi:hypothetical protein
MTPQRSTDRDIIKAFAVLGLAWLDRLPRVGDAIAAAVHSALELCGDGTFRPIDPAIREAYPEGLTLTEALGWTLASAAARNPLACPVLRYSPGFEGGRPCWIGLVQAYDAKGDMHLTAEETEKVAAAWLTIRLAMRPTVPWGPRDGIAEELRRHARDASAYVRPAKVETLTPETIASDVGRNWSSSAIGEGLRAVAYEYGRAR